MDIHQRVGHLLEIFNYRSINKFAEDLNITGQSLGSIINGHTTPSFKVLNAILSLHKNIDARWLITGEGIPLTDETIDNSELELLITDILLMKQSMAQLLARIDALEKDR